MANENWHLSKSVPITFIAAVVFQTGAIGWFISELNASVETNARDLLRHETRIEVLETAAQSQAVALARMDANIQAIRDIVEQMARTER
jgi:hypothetical protein